MAGVKAAVFSVTVDNEQDIRAWLADFQAAHDRVKKELDVLCALARETPLIQLTIHRDTPDESARNDGGAFIASGAKNPINARNDGSGAAR